LSLPSSSWPFSWSRRNIAFLFLLIASVTALGITALRAQPAAVAITSALILNDKQEVYDAVSAMYHTRDVASELGAREIFLRHRNNLRGDRVPPGPINLSFDPVPHWLIVDVVNKSHKSDWVLDFGPMSGGRIGLAPQIFVQDGQRGTMLLDSAGGATFTGKLIPNRISLRIMPDQQMTLIMRVVPSDHAPFIIAPRVIEAASLMNGSPETDQESMPKIVLMLLIGTCVFFAGCMLLNRGVAFFPHALFFASQSLWFMVEGGYIHAGIPGGAHLAGIATAAGGLFALASTQSIMAAQETEAGDSLLLYICASFVVLAIIMFVFIVPEQSYMRLGVIGLATAVAYLFAAFKALTVKKDLRRTGLLAGAAWCLMLFGIVMPYLVVFGYMPMSAILLQAPWLVMPLVCALMIASGAAYVRAGNRALVREVLRQAQRAQVATKQKQSKETADQARLLRVIEREREIMEDLRSREAERTEEMRLAKITADEANRAKSAFLAVVSHEIRTPMTGIMGMVRLLLDTQMSREQKDYAQTIQDSGDAMLALLNDILDFSKIEGGGMTLETIDFDLHRVAQSVAMLMNGHAVQRGIELKTDIDVDAPRYLKGDPTRLRQVLLNLVGNAIKFTPRGSVTIKLRTGDPELVPAGAPDLLPVAISVEDTGIGISEEASKNLFSPFSQADSSIARKFGGTGLGLAICKRLIEAMGSDIKLSSIEGQGTTFSFTLLLPPGDQAAAQAEGRANEILSGSNLAKPMQILVVDDNPVNRKVMEGLLARDGHRVTAVSGGQEALNLLGTKTFELIFMDIEMPEMNGIEAMKRIAAHEEKRVRDIPVVALTGNVAEEDKVRYKQAGMRDTLAKPIDPERLRNIMLAHGKPLSDEPIGSGPTVQPKKAKPIVTWQLTPEELEEDTFAGSIEYTTVSRAPVDDGLPVVGADEAMPDTAADDGVQAPDPQPAPQTSIPDELDPALFDESLLGSLRQSLGEAQLNEMMDGVFAHNKTVLPTLQTAFNDGDKETLRGCAHELKGMNGNFGLKAISDISAMIETACRAGNVPFDTLDDMVFVDLPGAMDRTEKLFRGQ